MRSSGTYQVLPHRLFGGMMRTMHRLVVFVPLVALLAGCGPSHHAAKPAAATMSVHGTVTLMDPDESDTWASTIVACSGSGGYGDIAGGAEVVISDDTGRTLTITQLKTGMYEAPDCVFKFDATVPQGKQFYGIEVTHRGVVKVQESQLGNIVLTIGSDS